MAIPTHTRKPKSFVLHVLLILEKKPSCYSSDLFFLLGLL